MCIRDRKKPAGKKSNNNNNNNNNSGSKASGDKPKCCCKKHGENFSHDTEDCKVLNGGDKKHKSNNYQGSNNKTWKKTGDESVTVSKKELQAMIASTTKQTIRDLHAAEKKRKSSDSDLDLNLMEVDGDLEGFNCSDMDDLKIEGEVDC